ncbi:MAG: tetratricopeptide repeat protein [Treponema sp.]|jgi:tetratricopeptide (TPR) repeat protein|nr:tetratricopeptide repeat protein [Treponema sp.]
MNIPLFRALRPGLFLAALVAAAGLLPAGCASWQRRYAEEYYTIGMAYFEMGKFEEAEKWLNRARLADRTQTASEYNLGRIAFETGRYDEAAAIYDRILSKDPKNIMALKAAAYTRIKTGDLRAADSYYRRVLALVPESADDGYNHALVLYAMGRYDEAEQVLQRHPFSLPENADVQLLLARIQRAMDKVEAVDSYAAWLAANQDPRVKYEYAEALEKAELYARALEQYRELMNEVLPEGDLKKQEVRFALARVLLVADAENPEGMTELKAAVSEGFAGTEAGLKALQTLAGDARIAGDAKTAIAAVIDGIPAPQEAVPDPSEADVEGGAEGAQD